MTGPMMVRWMPRAVADFEKIAEYYRLNAPAVERHILLAIYEGIGSLAAFPHKGRPTSILDTRRLVIVDTPYAVTYRLRGSAIQILRIRHGARKPLKS